jgi:hypothetical protein
MLSDFGCWRAVSTMTAAGAESARYTLTWPDGAPEHGRAVPASRRAFTEALRAEGFAVTTDARAAKLVKVGGDNANRD